MYRALSTLKGNLVVSCQAAPGDPLDDVAVLRRITLASIRGGAGGLRLNGAACIAAVRGDTNLPIIGIKKIYMDGVIRITPDFAAAAELAQSGADIIAVDCTDRTWSGGIPWQELIERIHNELHLPVMADIATREEALAAAAAGADSIGTTLNGYTEKTRHTDGFDCKLLSSIVAEVDVPVIAEGHISTPADARQAMMNGAWCVVVGSAITRPASITARFANAVRNSASARPVIGVDIGGTSIKAGLVDHKGCISFPVRIPTTASGGRETIAAAVIQAIDHVLISTREAGMNPAGIGIASAGAIDVEQGTVFAATENLPGWTGFALREFVEGKFGLPAYVENDAHAAALAAMFFGPARSLKSFAAITIGTGVGGGFAVNGQLVRGRHGFAGNFGHLTIRPRGRDCTCGRQGCLEAYVSAAALATEYRQRCGPARCDGDAADSELAIAIAELARKQDPIALEAYSALAEYLAEGIANLSNVLDPEAVFVSGGLVEGQTWFIKDVEKRVEKLLHFGSLRRPHIQISPGGHQAGMLGAAAAMMTHYE